MTELTELKEWLRKLQTRKRKLDHLIMDIEEAIEKAEGQQKFT